MVELRNFILYALNLIISISVETLPVAEIVQHFARLLLLVPHLGLKRLQTLTVVEVLLFILTYFPLILVNAVAHLRLVLVKFLVYRDHLVVSILETVALEFFEADLESCLCTFVRLHLIAEVSLHRDVFLLHCIEISPLHMLLPRHQNKVFH